MDPHRAERLSEALREELSEIIGYEMDDPRIQQVDVTEVLLAPDTRHARVRIHLGGDKEEQQKTIRALEGARHYLRRQLTARLRLFRVPDLHFEADLSSDAGSRVEQLLRRIQKGRPKPDEISGKKENK